jgi:uncharacterized membrane protein YjfL (UPF0719 family)
MKEQIALLKSKLEKETIVSDTMLRRVLNDKARTLKTMGLGKTLACFLAVPLMLWCNWFLGMSMLFTVVTTVYLSFAFIYTYITHRDINRMDLMNDDLIAVGEKVAKLKRRYSSWVLYGIPFVLCWFAWFFYELKNAGLPSENMDAALNGVLIGGTIGLIMGVMRYRKVQRVANDVLQQIKEMKEDVK